MAKTKSFKSGLSVETLELYLEMMKEAVILDHKKALKAVDEIVHEIILLEIDRPDDPEPTAIQKARNVTCDKIDSFKLELKKIKEDKASGNIGVDDAQHLRDSADCLVLCCPDIVKDEFRVVLERMRAQAYALAEKL